MTTSKKEPVEIPTENKGPDYYAHAVLPDGRGTRIASSIGAVFNHNKGKGFQVILDAMPAPNQYGQFVFTCFPNEPK